MFIIKNLFCLSVWTFNGLFLSSLVLVEGLAPSTLPSFTRHLSALCYRDLQAQVLPILRKKQIFFGLILFSVCCSLCLTSSFQSHVWKPVLPQFPHFPAIYPRTDFSCFFPHHSTKIVHKLLLLFSTGNLFLLFNSLNSFDF